MVLIDALLMQDVLRLDLGDRLARFVDLVLRRTQQFLAISMTHSTHKNTLRNIDAPQIRRIAKNLLLKFM